MQKNFSLSSEAKEPSKMERITKRLNVKIKKFFAKIDITPLTKTEWVFESGYFFLIVKN